jgi:SAM-dependent methyltransferase
MNRDCRSLPEGFLERLAELEKDYLRETDPIRQSGFRGGAGRWLAERSPILDAMVASGDLLDVGCANGYLLECLVQWGAARGLRLTPYGVDCSAQLIALARGRMPQYADHFFVGNAWDWHPPQRFEYVYSVWDCVPPEYFGEYVQRLLNRMVTPGGVLIIGAYGNRSRAQAVAPIDSLLSQLGLTVLGTATAGLPELARFAWVQANSSGR